MLALVILVPFFWMVSVSLKPATEPFAIPARLWPDNPTLENYATAFRPEFRIYFVNSMVVSLSTVADHRVAGTACRLYLHAHPDARDPDLHEPGHRGADVSRERDHHPDLQAHEEAPIC